ncbi:hypothetical protein PTSG_09165 [Salpingoeca rosetta]|uniref:non-specific serine/threonine protein kinase n=1 Tax=Salpingoeca rosetta (strain ATCC 50818 / BSB-021) TaxID=946362 RepID=F2UMX1_SALR5|nr:uncharacterized protein PTSG_09165 [Salpingoeca rosetta]EGD78470.1 hypothetical protein PTSG_09165 [Salpingoeca rosetta]|eukprot:XP_004989419.1 hypothetical protein PTSG_09165 [Salpingoeca rosetta]
MATTHTHGHTTAGSVWWIRCSDGFATIQEVLKSHGLHEGEGKDYVLTVFPNGALKLTFASPQQAVAGFEAMKKKFPATSVASSELQQMAQSAKTQEQQPQQRQQQQKEQQHQHQEPQQQQQQQEQRQQEQRQQRGQQRPSTASSSSGASGRSFAQVVAHTFEPQGGCQSTPRQPTHGGDDDERSSDRLTTPRPKRRASAAASHVYQPVAKPLTDPVSEENEEKATTQELQALQALVQQLARAETQMAARAKLMLVGEGAAGKTSTLRSLLGESFLDELPSTQGTESKEITADSTTSTPWKVEQDSRSELSRCLLATASHARDPNHLTPHSQAPRQATAHPSSTARSQQPQQSEPREQQQQGDQRREPPPSPPTLSADLQQAIRDVALAATLGDGWQTQVTFKVFDLGGQSTFYIFHPFFLTKYAVYLVVFSMRKLLRGTQHEKTETWDFLAYWLSSLHLHANGAPIFIVGTHADDFPDQEEGEHVSKRVSEHVSERIRARLSSNPAFQSVVYNDPHRLWFWPVDNTRSAEDPMIQDLRKAISATALEQPYVTQHMPVSYLNLYDQLNTLSRDRQDRSLFTMQEVDAVARTCGLRTREETTACLRFLHLYSMLFFYDHVPGMQDYVILSPQWAVDKMTRVIRNFSVHPDPQRDPKAQALGGVWDDLVQRGILHRSVLDVLWSDMHDQAPGLADPFLNLMLEYGLCVEYTPPADADADAGAGHAFDAAVSRENRAAQQQQHQQRLRQYVVPAILPMTLGPAQEGVTSLTLSTTAAAQLYPYPGYESEAVYIVFSFEFFRRRASVTVGDVKAAAFMPEGLFPLILASVMEHAQHGARDHPWLSRTRAIIDTDVAEIELQLVPAVGGIRLKVSHHHAQPRTLLQALPAGIHRAVSARYRDLNMHVLVPNDETTLLFTGDVRHHHKHRRPIRIGPTVTLAPQELSRRYRHLLPIDEVQDCHDVFLSYSAETDAVVAASFADRLQIQNVSVVADPWEVIVGHDMCRARLVNIAHSTVASPVLSARAFQQVKRQCTRNVACGLLLDWTAIVVMFRAASGDMDGARDKLMIRRIAPVTLRRPTPDLVQLEALVQELPDTPHKPTMLEIANYFTVLGLPLPVAMSVRTVASTLLNALSRVMRHTPAAAPFDHHMQQQVGVVHDAVTLELRLRTSTQADLLTPDGREGKARDLYASILNHLWQLSADERHVLAAQCGMNHIRPHTPAAAFVNSLETRAPPNCNANEACYLSSASANTLQPLLECVEATLGPNHIIAVQIRQRQRVL